MSTLTIIEEEEEVSVEEISETKDSESKLLLSDEELRDVYGKKRSLETLLIHPVSCSFQKIISYKLISESENCFLARIYQHAHHLLRRLHLVSRLETY